MRLSIQYPCPSFMAQTKHLHKESNYGHFVWGTRHLREGSRDRTRLSLEAGKEILSTRYLAPVDTSTFIVDLQICDMPRYTQFTHII